MVIVLLKHRHTLRNYFKWIRSKVKRTLPGLKKFGTYKYWKTLIIEWKMEMHELWVLTLELLRSPWWTFPWWLLLWMAFNIFLKIALLYWAFCGTG